MKREDKIKLVQLLLEAEELARQYSGGYSNDFISVEEFHIALKQGIDEFIAGDDSQIDNFWIWFAPTTSWDDFIGMDGLYLGDRIFSLVDEFKKRNAKT